MNTAAQIELNCWKWPNKVDGIKTFSKNLLKKSRLTQATEKEQRERGGEESKQASKIRADPIILILLIYLSTSTLTSTIDHLITLSNLV